MYDGYSDVSAEFLELRKLVLARKQPRRMLVQANTNIQGKVANCFSYTGNYSCNTFGDFIFCVM